VYGVIDSELEIFLTDVRARNEISGVSLFCFVFVLCVCVMIIVCVCVCV